MARLLLSCRSIFQVIAADESIFMVLGYHPHQIIGNSIMIFAGPQSDCRMLQNAILTMQGHKMQLVLYDCAGRERRLIVSCSPLGVASISLGCMVTFQSSEAITLQDAFTDCPQARILVSADSPYEVHMANDAFLRHSCCLRSDILGQPLNFPQHRSSINTSNLKFKTEFAALIRSALDGRNTTTNSSGGCLDEVSCAPVVEAQNGCIRHLLFTFSSPRGCSGAGTIPLEQQASGSYSEDLNAAARIFPRRKSRADAALAPAAPVVVTRELVAFLAGLPLCRAAAAAGVCTTSFKKACRKLGVRRWTYRRRSKGEGVVDSTG